MAANAKGRPALIERRERRARQVAEDERGSTEARKRAGGRCEVVVDGSRCQKRDAHTHHLIGGWKLRGRGPSALAIHKQRACVDCHRLITGNALRLRQPSQPHPLWTDEYERVD